MVLKVIHTNTVCILPSFPDFPTLAFDCLRDVMLDGGNEANCIWLVKTTILSYKLHLSPRGSGHAATIKLSQWNAMI